MNDGWKRLILAAAGLTGAAGVMAAAASSHAAETRNLGAIAAICLAHGPALLALALGGRSGRMVVAAMVIAGGTLIFASDLGAREWLGHGLFPGAAPLGGVSMVAGWLLVAVSAIAGTRNAGP